MNFKELTDIVYINHYKENDDAGKTQIMLNDLINVIGKSKSIKKIDITVIDYIVTALKQRGNSNATINRKLAILSKVLGYAQERGYIPVKPKIHSLPVQNSKILYFTEEEEQKLLDYFKQNNITMYYFCVLGFKTGMRAENILDLSTEDIQDGYIRVWRNKADYPYSIPMNDLVKEVVEAIKQDDMFLHSLNYQIARLRWKDAIKELDLNEKYTIHTMRHTFCSRLVQRGVELHIVQKLAGHKDARMTQRYAHLSNKNLEDAIKVL